MVIFALIAAAIVALDQVTKYLVSVNLPETGDTFPLIENVLHFTRVNNTGAAFGMLSDHRWVFMVISGAAIIGAAVWIIVKKPKNALLLTAVGMIAGGGIGNMIDRIRLGYVIDFIDCRFINFYVFNVADSFVCIGCGFLIIYLVASEIRNARKKRGTPAEAGASSEPENSGEPGDTREGDGT